MALTRGRNAQPPHAQRPICGCAMRCASCSPSRRLLGQRHCGKLLQHVEERADDTTLVDPTLGRVGDRQLYRLLQRHSPAFDARLSIADRLRSRRCENVMSLSTETDQAQLTFNLNFFVFLRCFVAPCESVTSVVSVPTAYGKRNSLRRLCSPPPCIARPRDTHRAGVCDRPCRPPSVTPRCGSASASVPPTAR